MIITAFNALTSQVEDVELRNIHKMFLENVKADGTMADKSLTVQLTIVMWSGKAIVVCEPSVAILLINKVKLHHAADIQMSQKLNTATLFMDSPNRTIYI